MKTLKHSIACLFVFAVFFVGLAQQAEAQITDTCWCPPLSYPKTGQKTNQDSNCVIDTCGIWFPSADCDSAYWNNIQSEFGEEAKKRVYGKRFWEILFTVPAIPIPPVPKPDTIIYVDWTAIDTAYPEIRNTFKQMEENFGDLYFRKLSPTADENAKRFRLYFTNYVNIDTITKIGRNITGIIVFDFVGWPYVSFDNVIENHSDDFIIQIYPNPAKDYIEIDINDLKPWINRSVQGMDDIMIYNIMGEEIQLNLLSKYQMNDQKFKVKIDISNLYSGIYYTKYKNKCIKFNIIK